MSFIPRMKPSVIPRSGPAPSEHPAHAYAERIRARLPHGLRELREAAGLSRYGLEKTSGISREMIGRIERGDANPSVCVFGQLCFGIGLTVQEFFGHLKGDLATLSGTVNDD